MASIFDDMPSTDKNPNALGSTGYSFYDADTLYDADGKGYRLQGVNALEVDRLGKEGEIGGDLTTEQAVRLANDLGYTEVHKTGEFDVTGKREIVDLRDKSGRSFRRQLAASGLTGAVPQFDPGGDLAHSAAYRRALKTTEGYQLDEFDEAAGMLKDHIDAEQKYDNQFKQKRLIPGLNADHIAEEGAVFERRDRDTRTGEANNPLSVAWDTGMLGAYEALYGMAELVGEKTGFEGLEDYGTAGVQRKRAEIGDQGKILTDYKDVDSFGDAVEFIGNNAILSLPYMAISAAGALAAPVTGGLSLAAPAAVYSGQAWNEMGDLIEEHGGERSASTAIATGVVQAALDRVGLSFVAGQLPPKGIFKKGVQALMKNDPKLSKAQATQALSEMTRKEMAGLLGDAAKVARQQVEAKKVVMDLVKRTGAGAGGEGVTEALQETVAAIGAATGAGVPIDWNDVQERAIAGAVAGATLGGAFSVPGTAYDVGAWHNVAVSEDRASPKYKTDASRYADQEFAEKGYVPSVQEEAANARKRVEGAPPLESINDRKQRHETSRKARTTKEALSDALNSIPGFFRGSVNNVFTDDVMGKSRAARVLSNMFGGHAGTKIFSGANFENAKHHRVTGYKNMVPTSRNFFTSMNGGKRANRRRYEELSNEFYNTARAAIDSNGNFNPDLVPEGPRKAAIVKQVKDMQALADKMWNDQKVFNKDLGRQKNYLLEYKAFNTAAIEQNRSEFIDALRDEYNIETKDAIDLVDAITRQGVDIDEAFSVVKGGPQPKHHKQKTLGLAKNPKFNKFMEQDMYKNMSEAAKSAARYVTYQEFIGDNGAVVSKLLDEMEAEGVDKAEVDKIASGLQDILDAESGNYKRPTTEVGKMLENVQRSFMFFTMLAGLPLATVSSLVEVALTQQALTNKQIFGKDGSMKALGKEFAEMVKKGALEVTYDNKPEDFSTPGRAAMKEVGYYDWDVGAATTTGVTELNKSKQIWTERFFKAIGLQGWTNFTRAARAAIAGDFIKDQLDIVSGTFQNDVNKTNAQLQAEQKLRSLGLDPYQMVDLAGRAEMGPLSEADQAALDTAIKEATFNFVNEAVALPQASNRPLIYQDPRFALFTQFQGFMSTFTANHIPRLWGEYVKRGTPAMKYNAFAVMTTMIMLGFASQYLKDLLKYGSFENPYLDDSEYIQRGIRASGLLGTGERILDQFMPIYETRSKDAGEWIFNTATGEAPALSNLERIGKGIGHIAEGNIQQGTRQLAKSAPGFGPVGARANEAVWEFLK